MTAICARFAASATRVKSRRKASVDGAWPAKGAGGGAMVAAGDCCVDEEEVEEDWLGAFMTGDGRLKAEWNTLIIFLFVSFLVFLGLKWRAADLTEVCG